MKRIAIFASGNGTNAQRIADYFRDHAKVEIALILCNKPDFVLLSGFLLHIPQRIISNYRGRMVNIYSALLPNY